MIDRIKTYIRKSPNAAVWIGCVYLPTVVGDKAYGWYSARRNTPEEAAQWCANVVMNHMIIRARYRHPRKEAQS